MGTAIVLFPPPGLRPRSTLYKKPSSVTALRDFVTFSASLKNGSGSPSSLYI